MQRSASQHGPTAISNLDPYPCAVQRSIQRGEADEGADVYVPSMQPPGHTITAAEGAEVGYICLVACLPNLEPLAIVSYTYLIQYTGQSKGNFRSPSKKHIQPHTLLQQKGIQKKTDKKKDACHILIYQHSRRLLARVIRGVVARLAAPRPPLGRSRGRGNC